MNNLAPIKNCPGGGVQGYLNWMPGYSRHSHFVLSAGSTHPNVTEKLLTRFNSLPHIFRTAKLSACKEYSILCVKLKGGKVIIGSPYQINKLYQVADEGG